MKLTLAILACVAFAAINAASVPKSEFTVDKGFLNKQKFLYEIVYRIEDPLQFEEYIKLGAKLFVDKTKYEVFDEPMVKFYESYKVGGLLPQGEFFSAVQKYHMLQAWGLFNFFYYAKDFETFVHNVAWARLNVNEGMFVYALTLAVIHRPDMKGLILPPIYEIFPQYFFNSKFIVHAEKFDFDVWNRQIMLEKELKTVYDKEYASEIYGKYFYLKDWKVWQWWKLMGLDEEWHLEEKTFMRNDFESYQKDPKYKAVFSDTKAFWFPVDYTRDIHFFNAESKLSYFTEDLGWNAYWYYLNMDYPTFLDGKKFDLYKDRRGEYWIYKVQQLLARYYMERLSQGFGDIYELSYYGPVKTGYDPQLIAYTGNGYTYRKNYFELESYENVHLVSKIISIEHRIKNIIDTGKYVTKDGVEVDLTKPESIEYIGNLMQGNIDILDKQFFGYWYTFSMVFLAGEDFDAFTVGPNVLLNYETMLRDPITYHLFKRIVDVFYKFKYNLPAYKHEELFVPGVKIVDAEVSKLSTYFDLVDTDVTNLLNDKMVFHDGKFVWDKTLLARQLRLNHKPFSFKLKVTADKIQDVAVRVFIAPEFDEQGQKIDLLKNIEHFYELDKFYYKLVVGENDIERFSKDFYYTIGDQTTYTELYKYVMFAYEGKAEYPLSEITEPHCGFPDRLILPHGWVKGMPMKFFFIITPYHSEHKQFSTYDHKISCGIGSGVRYFDGLPFGYPFDRKIESPYEFFVPNMFFKEVKIYHTEKYVKYYPERYEHYGTFDYTY